MCLFVFEFRENIDDAAGPCHFPWGDDETCCLRISADHQMGCAGEKGTYVTTSRQGLFGYFPFYSGENKPRSSTLLLLIYVATEEKKKEKEIFAEERNYRPMDWKLDLKPRRKHY